VRYPATQVFGSGGRNFSLDDSPDRPDERSFSPTFRSAVMVEAQIGMLGALPRTGLREDPAGFCFDDFVSTITAPHLLA
jgi:hypothetical protein